MSLTLAHNNLMTVLTGNAAIKAWVSEHFTRKLQTLNGNVPVEVIKPEELPLLINEVGDGETEIQVGGNNQSADTDIPLALVWYEDDPAKAFTQRLTLPELVVKAVMANTTLQVSNVAGVAEAYISGWQSDKAVNHPMHVMRFTAAITLEIDNS